MNKFFSMIDWKENVFLIVFFLVSLCALVASIIVFVSYSKNLRSSNFMMEDVHFRTQEAVENREKLNKYIMQMNDMVSSGYMSEPNRLQWLQSLQEVVDFYRIPQVKFTLSPTVDLGEADADYQGQEVRQGLLETPMILEMELMHEGDFYHVLLEFRKKALGVFRVESCELSRVDSKLTEKSILLSAQCRLTWLNYRDPRYSWEEAV